MISEEERKAINDLEKTIKYYNEKFKENKKITTVLVDNFDVNNLFILLNLIETQNKMIELMAELIFNHRNSFEWWENGIDIDNLEQQIEYFRNKAKESE